MKKFFNSKTLLSLLLLMAISVSALCASCAKENKQTTEASKPVPRSNIHISEYAIVRGDTSGNAVLKQVLSLKNAIAERFSSTPEVFTDWNAWTGSEQEDPSAKPEILVGITNRNESIVLNNALSTTHGYVIYTMGNKIVITASTNALLQKAVEHFITAYLVPAHDGYLPAIIGCRYSDSDTLYFKETEEVKPALYLSSEASSLLTETAQRFCKEIQAFSGISIEIKRFKPTTATVVLTMPGLAFPVLNDFEQTGWQISTQGGSLILQGENETVLLSALASAYTCFEENKTESLHGVPLLPYSSQNTASENTPTVFPLMMGGSYLGHESVSHDSEVHYFEHVSASEFSFFTDTILSGIGYTVVQGQEQWICTNAETNTKLTLIYNVTKQALTVIENRHPASPKIVSP